MTTVITDKILQITLQIKCHDLPVVPRNRNVMEWIGRRVASQSSLDRNIIQKLAEGSINVLRTTLLAEYTQINKTSEKCNF
jgi:hypothetical protein